MRTPNFDQMGWSPLEQEAARALPPPIPLHMALAGMMGESGEAAMRLLHKWSLENAFNWETVREELRARHRINDLVGACAALFAPQEEQSALLELIWQALAAPTSVSPNLAAIVFALDPDFMTKAEQLGTALAAIPPSPEAYNAFMQAQRALAAILALGRWRRVDFLRGIDVQVEEERSPTGGGTVALVWFNRLYALACMVGLQLNSRRHRPGELLSDPQGEMSKEKHSPKLFEVNVEFFLPNWRKHPVRLGSGQYWPHLRVVSDSEHLGVKFVRGPDWVELGSSATAVVQTIFENVHYEKLKAGVQFEILEGPHVVGKGVVIRELSAQVVAYF